MSSRVNLSSVLKSLVAGAVLASIVVAVVAIASSPAQAIALPGTTTYYSSANYKTIVGAETYGCCGEYSSWGIKTKYKKFERFYCLDVLCPN